MAAKIIKPELTENIIGCAISVHRALGPGFLEKFYEEALCIELDRKKLKYKRQCAIALNYREQNIGIHRMDLIVEDCVIVELKAVKKFEDVHFATTLSYLKVSGAPIALLLNFYAPTLNIRRFAHSSALLTTETLKDGSAEDIVKFMREGESLS